MTNQNIALVVPAEFKIHYKESMTHVGFEIAGLLNWAPALGNPEAVHTIDDDLNRYTHIITNVSSTEAEYIPLLKMMHPDKVIIACLDYSFEILEQYGTSALIHRMLSNLSRADIAFSVHEHQKEWIEAVVPGITVHHCPHPVDTDSVDKFVASLGDRTDNTKVVVMHHQYDDKYLQALFLLRDVERELVQEGKLDRVPITLAGLKFDIFRLGKSPTMVPNCSNCGARGGGIPHPQILSHGYPAQKNEDGETVPFPTAKAFLDNRLVTITSSGHHPYSFDSFEPYASPPYWISSLFSSSLVLDFSQLYSIGRTGIECAAVGIPYLAGGQLLSVEKLHQKTAIDQTDPKAIKKVLKKLLTNSKFRSNIGNMARRQVRAEFGFEASAKRMRAVIAQRNIKKLSDA